MNSNKDDQEEAKEEQMSLDIDLSINQQDEKIQQKQILNFEQKQNSSSSNNNNNQEPINLQQTEDQYLESQNHIRNNQKKQQQLKALFYKNIALQSKQMGTNICQILTPLVCLLFVFLIKNLAKSQQSSSFSLPFPFLFNVPGLYNAYPFIEIDCLQWYMYNIDKDASQETKDFVGYNSGIPGQENSGLLGNIGASEKCSFMPDIGEDKIERNVPFFDQPPVNQTINEYLYNSLIQLNEEPFTRGMDMEGSAYLPDGAINFYEASDEKLKYSIQINDVRMKEYHHNNGITKLRYTNPQTGKSQYQIRVAEGMLSLIDLVNRAYLRTINDDVWIVSGIQYMPLVGEDTGFVMRLISVTGASLYPLALSLLLPIFMYTIVLEKEEKLLEMMKMNGMKMQNYWFVTFVFCVIITFFTFSCFYLFGYFVLQLDFFVDTGFDILFVVLLGWGLTQICMAFFFQVFLGKARSSTIIGYLVSIWTCLISVTFNAAVYPAPYTLPYGMRMYPPFGFARLIYDISVACSNGACYQNIGQISEEMKDCLAYLYGFGIIFLLLGIYLHEVVPQEYGVQQHPLFFLKCLKRQKTQEQLQQQQQGEDDEDLPEYYENLQEDDDAKAEREFVKNMKNNSSEINFQDYPLITKNLRKVYDQVGGRPKHVAVKSMCLSIKAGEIFGLLGPNGTGKTTLISMITGMFPPTSGTAWIAGYNIKTQMNLVHLNIGVCPQFNLLWPELTVQEHLLFYARLKGVPQKLQDEMVERSIKEVYLTKFTHFRTKELSGGMQRRLSVAISLVGDPKIIFLDEPSTGLDPENRRQLWDILSECRGKRAMVLTTHSMEESDVLCTKIGIMTNGVLRCVGPQVRLKSLYGGGYHLYINCHKDKYLEKLKEENEQLSELNEDEVVGQDDDLSSKEKQEKNAQFYQQKIFDFISEILPAAKILSSFNGNLIYQVPMEGLMVSQLFEELEQKKEELRISDWGISQSSLEDVFMKIVETVDKSED